MEGAAFHPFVWWIAGTVSMFWLGWRYGFAIYLPVAALATIGIGTLWYLSMYTDMKFRLGFGLFVLFAAAPAYVLGLLAGLKGAKIHRRNNQDALPE